MPHFSLIGINVKTDSKQTILEKIRKYITSPNDFFHIVSINPENIVDAQQNQEFKKVIETAQIHIIDGSGVLLAARLNGCHQAERLTGVDLMEQLIELTGEMRLRIMLIGGFPKVAEELSDCYNQSYPKAEFRGLTGIKDINDPQKSEEEKIFSIVTAYMPHILFVSFGSPAQELWLYRHRDRLKGIVCVGVGGAFDFLSGRVARAPQLIRQLGMEWMFRLFVQPWRWRRQLKLFKFIGLFLKDKLRF